MAQGNEWENLRKQARQLENEIDLKLVSFSKLGTGHGPPKLESEDTVLLLSGEHMFETMALEIEQLLAKGVWVRRLGPGIWFPDCVRSTTDHISGTPSLVAYPGLVTGGTHEWLTNWTPLRFHVEEWKATFFIIIIFQLSQLNEQMGEISSSQTNTSSGVIHTMQRHREILQDYKQEFHKTRSNYQARREKEELLKSVRKDIE
uniref:Golgi SNAP receptor complex member 1 n=1 Tax=Timema monikensis TaxID=170555 RepID=A0A7R9ECJ4_9NEOP|nr:unnamed protein product [Timema monikensis]